MTPMLVFDGDCAFCSSTIRVAKRLVKRLPRVVPHQQLDDDALRALGLDRVACATAVQFVGADGRVHAAERAVAEVLRAAGGVWRPIGAVLSLPVVRNVAGVVYRWVARNRHRLPGGTPACSVVNDRT